jgi:ribosomal protein S18 acetylase RimI-like enzyme
MLTIRPARPDDQSYLLALTERLAAFPIPPWRTAAEIAQADQRLLRETLESPRDDVFIVVAETRTGERLGYLFATTCADYFTGARQAHIEVLAVEQHAEGRGVAGALMKAVERWARSRRYASVTLNVFATNRRARGLYEHVGYQEETLHYFKRLGEREEPGAPPNEGSGT